MTTESSSSSRAPRWAHGRRTLGTLLASAAVVGAVAAPTLAWAAPTTAVPAAVAPALSSLPSIPGDCKGDPPTPDSPYGHLSVRPVVTSTGDPFADKGVSIESVYGTTYRWWAYDNGCEPGAGVLPTLGTHLGSVMLETAGVVPNWGHYLMDAVVDPSAWIGVLDPVVEQVTADVAQSVWTPWLLVVLLLVAALVLWRSRSGQLAGAVTAAAWALLVLVFCTWAMNYPAEAIGLVDQGVQTVVVDVSEGFAAGESGSKVTLPPSHTDEPWWRLPTQDDASRSAALRATDRLYDKLIRNTQYRTWLVGAFGDPDSPTATKYGPAAFKATHFTFAEYDTYRDDPEGAGKKLIEDKASAFKDVAEKISKADPVAYRHFTGNEWPSHLAAGMLNLVVVLAAGLFLLVAALCVLIAYVIVRLAVPITPAAGILFMVETFRDRAMGVMSRIAGPVVMGPIFLVVGLIVLRFNSAIADAPDINFVLKLCLILAVSILAWRLCKPMDVLRPKVRIRGLKMLRQYLATRAGTRAGASDAQKKQDDEATSSGSSQGRTDRPVYQIDPRPVLEARSVSTPLALPAGPVRTSTVDATFSGRPRRMYTSQSGVTTVGYPLDDIEEGLVVMRTRGAETAAASPTGTSQGTYRPAPAPRAIEGSVVRAEQVDSGTPAWQVAGGQEAPATLRPATDVDAVVDQAPASIPRSDVREEHLTYGEGRKGVFRVYHPGGETVYVRAEGTGFQPITPETDALKDGE